MYGSSHVKRLERLILRGLFYNLDEPVEGAKPMILLYASVDGVNFDLCRGMSLNCGGYKDIDMGLFARSKYRQFLLGFVGQLDEVSRIKEVETMIQKEYGNSKMR